MQIPGVVIALGEAVTGLFYPEVCQFCRTERAIAVEGYVCRECWQQVRFVVPPFCERCGLPFIGEITGPFECANCRGLDLHFGAARSAVIARGIVLEAIHHFKYRQARWLEPFLAGLFVQVAAPDLSPADWDALVPVPLHPVREREREFNQAERLAEALAAATGIPVHRELLRRVEATPTQTLLTREQRADNMRRAFAVADDVIVTGLRVVLIDDVLTTGATTSACAKGLRRRGAAAVNVWTLARGV